MKKIIVITILLFSPFGAFASENWKLEESTNALSLSGDCIGSEVSIDLYQAGKDELIYNSGAVCKDGKFKFSDNLLQWKSLNEGNYDLVVNGERKNSEKIVIEKPTESIAVSSVNVVEVSQSGPTPELKFLGAFVSLQQSILDMRTWLAQTDYPDLAKQTIGIALDGLDLAVGKLSTRVLSSENSQTQVEVSKQSEDKQDPVATDIEQEENSIDSESGMTVQDDSDRNEMIQMKIVDQVEPTAQITIDTGSEGLKLN